MSTAVGSCLCGEVAFEVEGSFDSFYLCHCPRCRKDTGSAHGASLFSSSARVRWISGEDKVTQYTLPSTQHSKAFCSVCGSALPNVQMEGKLLVVPAGSLDGDIPIAPTAHICVSNKAKWDNDLHRVPRISGLPA